MSEAVAVPRCPRCGGAEWQPARPADRCAQCGLTYQQADERATHLRRQLEHKRRAALVVEATLGMPMQRRIRVAKYLLLECGPLPNGEPWDAVFRAWRVSGSP